jgi:hemoglobin
MAAQDSPSLYERLGGVYSIATLVNDFIDRIMVDPAECEPEGRRGPSSRSPCRLQVPRHGNGLLGYRRTSKVHRPLHEGVAQKSLQQALDKFAVPEAEQAEIKAIVASTRADIVV